MAMLTCPQSTFSMRADDLVSAAESRIIKVELDVVIGKIRSRGGRSFHGEPGHRWSLPRPGFARDPEPKETIQFTDRSGFLLAIDLATDRQPLRVLRCIRLRRCFRSIESLAQTGEFNGGSDWSMMTQRKIAVNASPGALDRTAFNCGSRIDQAERRAVLFNRRRKQCIAYG